MDSCAEGSSARSGTRNISFSTSWCTKCLHLPVGAPPILAWYGLPRTSVSILFRSLSVRKSYCSSEIGVPKCLFEACRYESHIVLVYNSNVFSNCPASAVNDCECCLANQNLGLPYLRWRFVLAASFAEACPSCITYSSSFA